MAFRYVVKKRMVGIGTKTEKYVAASYSVANIDFDRLCDQVTSQGMVPRGIVKAVLDGMIDALCTYQHRCNRTAGRLRKPPTGIERQKPGGCKVCNG